MRLSPADVIYPVRTTAPGEIALPPFLMRRLRLAPGEIFALVAGPQSLQLDRYTELLTQLQGLATVDAWTEIERFQRAPLAGLSAAGTLQIPAELGDFGFCDGAAWLQVVWRGPSPKLYLFLEAGEEARGAVA